MTELNPMYKKIVDFQSRFYGVEKNRENTFTKSKYANLEDVMGAATPIMAEIGIYVAQPLSVTDDGTQLLTTTVFDLEGNHIDSVMNITKMCEKNDAQRVGSAITYARRYSFCSIMNILQHDDDGNGATNGYEKPSTDKQQKEIFSLITQTGTEMNKISAYINTNFGADKIEDLTMKQAGQITKMLKAKL